MNMITPPTKRTKMNIFNGLSLPFLAALLSAAGCFPDLPEEDTDTKLLADTDANASIETSGADGVSSSRVPQDIEASTNDLDTITVSWSPVVGASSYRVYRCDAVSCPVDGPWTLLPNGETLSTIYTDVGAEGPPAPEAVIAAATNTATANVTVSWGALSDTPAPTYKYRVAAVFADEGEAPPSSAVAGSRRAAAINRYEVSINEGPWVSAGAGTSWQDTTAPAPTLSAGTATASQGTISGWVALSLGGTSSTAGAARNYQVRAVNATAAGAPSAVVTGWRAATTTWNISWERSSGASPDDYESIVGSAGAEFQDIGAPENGATRYYRAAVSSDGLETAFSEAVSGSRAPPPGTPGNVRATSDLADRVEVRWTVVSGATKYLIHRNGEVIFEVTDPQVTLWTDESSDMALPSTWSAPTSVTASTDSLTTVMVRWVAPERPVGLPATYEVEAVNASGTGGKSAPAIGRRAAPALVGYAIEATVSGISTPTTVEVPVTATSWSHDAAPSATIATGTMNVTQGEHRGFVWLTLSGHTIDVHTVAYRVRGLLADEGFTPWSATADGNKTAGPLSVQWQRTATANASAAFTNLSAATTATFDDSTAPADGESRWYRATLSAEGVTSATTDAMEGWRLAFVEIAVGELFGCAATNQGRVWCWGKNDLGQLGLGFQSASELGPQRLSTLDDVLDISLGATHGCALKRNGRVACWGSNLQGRTGLGILTGVTDHPTEVSAVQDVIEVSCGVAHTCVRTSSGAVRCWGANARGQLGNNSVVDSPLPVDVLIAPGTSLTNATQISAFQTTSCALRSDRKVYCWGSNYFREIGDGTTENRSVATNVSSLPAIDGLAKGGSSFSPCAVSAIGMTYCWGNNYYGQLGFGAAGDAPVSPPTTPVSGGRTFKPGDVAVGSSSACGIASNGAVWCWGANAAGQLGAGVANEPTASSTPLKVGVDGAASKIAVGHYAACAIFEAEPWCWGTNSSGGLGSDPTSVQLSAVPIPVPLP